MTETFSKHKNISTDGIEVHSIPINADKSLGFAANKLQMQLFDFGGQEVFTMTHSLFLSHDAVYIVAFNPLQPDGENRLGYTGSPASLRCCSLASRTSAF